MPTQGPDGKWYDAEWETLPSVNEEVTITLRDRYEEDFQAFLRGREIEHSVCLKEN